MWLLIGGDSEIGAATFRRLRSDGRPVAATTRRRGLVGPDRPFLDLADPLDDWEPPDGVLVACICAAVARLVDCDRDPVGSGHTNVTQTLALCERLIARHIHVLFLSTNQVFDGNTPHVPASAPTAPVSQYGRQKARIEAALRAHMDRGAGVAILRLARVVSPELTLIRNWTGKLRATEPIRAFHDMTLAPTPIDLVVDAIVHVLQDEASGIFQLSGPRDVAYVELGCHIAERLGADVRLVQSVSAEAAGMPVGATPRHTTLDSSLVRDRYGISVPEPWETIDKLIARR